MPMTQPRITLGWNHEEEKVFWSAEFSSTAFARAERRAFLAQFFPDKEEREVNMSIRFWVWFSNNIPVKRVNE